jgi:glycosyltransferase involved in cell wall biosynthesis
LRGEHPNVHLITVFNKSHEIVAKYMNACDAIALASNHEGAPMSVREAMACNLPIVSVDVGDVGQIIRGIENCYLCDQDAQDMAEKLGMVLSRGYRTNGSRAIREMDETWAAEQVLSIYKHVIKDNA